MNSDSNTSNVLSVPDDKKVCEGCSKLLPLVKFQRLYDKDKKFIGYRAVHRGCDRGKNIVKDRERIDTKVNNLRLDLDSMDSQTTALIRNLNGKLSSLSMQVGELQSQVKQLSMANREHEKK